MNNQKTINHLKPEYVPADDLIPYINNARTHDEDQVAKIAASIREFGFLNPILIDDEKGIIAGHGRLMSALKLNMSTVPCLKITNLSEAKKKAYILADNRLALSAGWNKDILSVELERLKELDFDISLTGFLTEELNDIIGDVDASGLVDENDAPPVVDEPPVTKTGDIWQLGDHRLICGDSTRGDTFQHLMADELADMCWTDPPYNVAYEGNSSGQSVGVYRKAIQNDNMDDAAFLNFLTTAFENIQQYLVAGGPFYICHAGGKTVLFEQALAASHLSVRQHLVWVKNGPVLSRQDYNWQHEPVLYGWKEGEKHQWYGGTDKKTVIFCDKPVKSKEHPTMKPFDLIEHMIDNSSKKDDIVLDPFGGSGSTLIVCEKKRRKCRIVELDEHYCDVIIERWQKYSGKIAVLNDGMTTFESQKNGQKN